MVKAKTSIKINTTRCRQKKKKKIITNQRVNRQQNNRNGILLGPLASRSQPVKLLPQSRPGLGRRLLRRRLVLGRDGRPRPAAGHAPGPRPAAVQARTSPGIHHAVAHTQVAGDVVKVAPAYALQPSGALLHGAELLEELAPADDALFSPLETVWPVECGHAGRSCVAVARKSVRVHRRRGCRDFLSVLEKGSAKEVWMGQRKSQRDTYGRGAMCR